MWNNRIESDSASSSVTVRLPVSETVLKYADSISEKKINIYDRPLTDIKVMASFCKMLLF